MTTKILVTGANGQLGNEIKLISRKHSDIHFYFTDVDELDITQITHVENFLKENPVDIIINCAAYNAVDKAEEDEESAFMINSIAVKHLSQLAFQKKIFLIHVSTDYVFDGIKNMPYTESDIVNPLSIYARSKQEGESQIQSTLKRGIIIRTSWLYSEYGNNFVKTIIKFAKDRDALNVVCDQVGTPTYAKDLAEVIFKLISRTNKIREVEIYHYSNEGVASWYDFAKAIVEISGINCQINPVETKNFPLPAHRPFFSILNKSKIKKFLDIDIPYWRESLKDCLQNINNYSD
ncbi:MAG: dTDP-4-dehydrorhamnose reductase [Bacteroidetes bacterium]|nr:dTDP-4-dehydrorhamnose reductase [Bacteroidota bacterium]